MIRKILTVTGLAFRKLTGQPAVAFLSLRMALWVVLISLMAKVTSLPRVQKIASFGVKPARIQRHSKTPAELARIIDYILGIDLFLFRRSCWKRALVLHRYLALNGIESQIRFGLRKESSGKMDGHAWLEREGQPLLEENAADYIVTFSLPNEFTASGQSTSSYHA